MTISTLWSLKWWLVAVGPNIIAAIVCAIPAGLVAWFKVVKPFAKRWFEHERRTREIHEHLLGGEQ